MLRYSFPLVTFGILAATNAAAAICVENGSSEIWLFTAASDAGERANATLAPDTRLCLQADGPGTVAAFENANVLEGCSRRVPSDSITRMLDFPSVDLCAWEAAPSE